MRRIVGRWPVLLIVLLTVSTVPAGTSASTDTTSPVGSWTWPAYVEATDELVIASSWTDPESGMATIQVSCDDGPVAEYPYTSTLRIPAGDPAAGGCAVYGERYLTVAAVNGAGLTVSKRFLVEIQAVVSFEYPLPATTGQPFTIRPIWPKGYVPAPAVVCRWEFRWGDTAALRDGKLNETYGHTLFEGTAGEGFCSEWTFTLPWVPVPQFELVFSGPFPMSASGVWPDREVFTAAVAGTDRRIHESNLPIAQVLPSTYTPIVGRSVTYTRYLVGGAPAGSGTWTAHLGTGDDPIVWEKTTTSSTFTITPPTTGRLLVQWYRETGGLLLSAGYDPPVRYADTTDPNTRAPYVRFAPGGSDTAVPVEISWTGTDSGWGIASYRLERSVDGGAWTRVALPTARTKEIVQRLTYGTAYRYRVRATDKAGNVGSWDYGATFKPRRRSDGNDAVRYSSGWRVVADPTAHGDVTHEATSKDRSVSFTFTGRAIAWLAERGTTFGTAKVYVDGVYIKTVDTRHDQNLPRRLVFRKSWSSVGTHRIRIVVNGTAGRPTISVDGFAILR